MNDRIQKSEKDLDQLRDHVPAIQEVSAFRELNRDMPFMKSLEKELWSIFQQKVDEMSSKKLTSALEYYVKNVDFKEYVLKFEEQN